MWVNDIMNCRVVCKKGKKHKHSKANKLAHFNIKKSKGGKKKAKAPSSRSGIRYARNGRPYRVLANGQVRFVRGASRR